MIISFYNLVNLVLLSIARQIFRKNSGNGTNHILIIRLDAIGDMILFSPFIRELRQQNQDAKITLVVSPLVRNLYKNCPYADDILYFNGRKQIKPQILTSTIRAMFWGAKYLKENYSKVLLPRSDTDAEGALMLAITSRADNIISFSEKQTSDRTIINKNFDLFVTKPILTKTPQHEVKTNLQFLSKIGYPDSLSTDLELWTTEKDQIKVVDFLCNNKINIKGHMILAIGISAAQKQRCWPIEKFLQVIQKLQMEYKNAKIILIGGPGDIDIANYCISKNNLITSAVGILSLRETLRLLESCNIYIGNDSGPMHLAAVAQIPIVEISSFPKNGKMLHPNSPIRFGPFGVTSKIIQPQESTPPCVDFCNKKEAHCIDQITADEVFNAINSILQRGIVYDK